MGRSDHSPGIDDASISHRWYFFLKDVSNYNRGRLLTQLLSVVSPAELNLFLPSPNFPSPLDTSMSPFDDMSVFC